MSFVVALDQGTSATKAVLVDETGMEVAVASEAVRRTHPRPGWVEQDPTELWESVLGALAQLPVARVGGIGVSAQRESVVVWDRASGAPLTPCVSWQCTRGAELCAALQRQGLAPVVKAVTGLPLGPMFSASKLAHLFSEDPSLLAAAERGDVCAGTVDSWLAWNLTGGRVHVTDAGNASRTALFDIVELEWSDRMLELFGIPAACLPEVVPSIGTLGPTSEGVGLAGAPLVALAADSHAALYGLGCRSPGTAKATYGTGTSVASPTGRSRVTSTNGLATSVAWLEEEPTYEVEGNVYSSGATLEWLAGLLGLANGAEVAALADATVSAGGVHVVPAFTGLGAPYWEPRARALIDGISFGTDRACLARAGVESVAFQVADLVVALEADTGVHLSGLRADGGATRNAALMQLQADLLALPVLRSRRNSAAVTGVGLMAAVALGADSMAAGLDSTQRDLEVFQPNMPEDQRAELLAGWRQAVGRAAPSRDRGTP